MEKTILIDGKQVRFKSTGGTPKRYQAQFGRGYIKDLMNMVEGGFKRDESGEINVDVEDVSKINIDVFYDIAWAFAKTADNTILPPLEWLDTFDEFPILEIMPELQELISLTLQTKKK